VAELAEAALLDELAGRLVPASGERLEVVLLEECPRERLVLVEVRERLVGAHERPDDRELALDDRGHLVCCDDHVCSSPYCF